VFGYHRSGRRETSGVLTFSPSAYCMLKWSCPSLRGISSSTDLLVVSKLSCWRGLVFFLMCSCIVTRWLLVNGVDKDVSIVYSMSSAEWWGRLHSVTKGRGTINYPLTISYCLEKIVPFTIPNTAVNTTIKFHGAQFLTSGHPLLVPHFLANALEQRSRYSNGATTLIKQSWFKTASRFFFSVITQ